MAKKGHGKKRKFSKTYGKVIARGKKGMETESLEHVHNWERVASRMFRCNCFACIVVIWDLIYSRDVIEKFNRYGWRALYMD